MTQYINKAAIAAEIKERIKECNKLADTAADNNLHSTLEANKLLIRQYTSLLSFLDTLEVKEIDLDEEFNKYCENLYLIDLENDPYAELFECAKHFFKLGLNANLWKSADGDDDLPELEREVIVFTQEKGLSPRVGIAHRPNPNGWDGTSISTGKTEHFQPMLYGKGGWSLPNVKWWLDVDFPFKENKNDEINSIM